MMKSNMDIMINDVLATKELPWMRSTSMSGGSKSKRKMRVSSKAPHQFILNAMDYIDDEYWRDIMEQIAYHKYPKGFIVKGYILSFKRNMSSIYSVNLEDLSPEDVCDRMIEFLSEHGNMKSSIDRENDRIVSDDILNRSEPVREWKDLRSAKKQNIFLMNYATELARDKELNHNDIFCLLNLEILLKNISPEDIVIRDNRIVSITGLEFRDGKYVISRRNTHRKSNARNDTPLNTKLMMVKPLSVGKSWDGILKSLCQTKTKTKSNRQMIAETLSEIESNSVQ